jgi:hypothetical protein
MTSNSIGITDERDILSMPFTLTQGAWCTITFIFLWQTDKAFEKYWSYYIYNKGYSRAVEFKSRQIQGFLLLHIVNAGSPPPPPLSYVKSSRSSFSGEA